MTIVGRLFGWFNAAWSDVPSKLRTTISAIIVTSAMVGASTVLDYLSGMAINPRQVLQTWAMLLFAALGLTPLRMAGDRVTQTRVETTPGPPQVKIETVTVKETVP